jgi:hypothetical protein
MRGNQSRHHFIEIRDDRLNSGVLITHIINVKISNQPQNGTHASQIRRILKQNIWNVNLMRNIEFPPRSNNFIPMTIRWEMPNVGNQCAYYFCVTAFNDIAVAHHNFIYLRPNSC